MADEHSVHVAEMEHVSSCIGKYFSSDNKRSLCLLHRLPPSHLYHPHAALWAEQHPHRGPHWNRKGVDGFGVKEEYIHTIGALKPKQ